MRRLRVLPAVLALLPLSVVAACGEDRGTTPDRAGTAGEDGSAGDGVTGDGAARANPPLGDGGVGGDGGADESEVITLGCDIAEAPCLLPVYNQVGVAFPTADSFLVTGLPSVDAGSVHKLRIYHSTDRGQTARVFPRASASGPPGLTVPPNADLYSTAIGTNGDNLLVITVLNVPDATGSTRSYATHFFRSTDGARSWSRAGGGLPVADCFFYAAIPQAAGGWMLAGRCTRGTRNAGVVARTNAELTTLEILDEGATDGGTPAFSFAHRLLATSDGCIYVGGASEVQQRPIVRRSCAGGPWVDDLRPSDMTGSIEALAEQAGIVYAIGRISTGGNPDLFPTILQRTGPLAWTAQALTSNKPVYPAFLEPDPTACHFVFGTYSPTSGTDLRRTTNCGLASGSFATSNRYFNGARSFGEKLRLAATSDDLELRSVTIPR